MSEILYFIFVFPLEQSLGFILQSLIKYLHSPALSIVAISILINVFLFKLFVFTDKKAQSYNDTKQKLDSRIKGWKSVYKGAKLHAFTKTLYRQNHYHPLYALIGLGGLALQIPFFIAMGLVISKSTLFENAKFLWITDLSKPDSVLGIHILPFAMTFFTLLNVFLASKQKSQIIQGIFIALIFLVLLYVPSALVLYWTINTLVYLLKSIVTKPKRSTQVSSQSLQAPHIAKPLIDKTSQTYKNISIFAILNILFLVCVFSPFAVYSSDVSQFDPTQTKATLSALFGIFLLASFVCIYLTSFFYNTRLLKLGAWVASVTLLMGFIYTFILDFNVITGEAYSQMDNFVFKNPGVISSSYSKYVDLAIGFSACIFGALFLRFAKFWEKTLKIIIASLVFVGASSLFVIYHENKKILDSKQEQTFTGNLENLLPSFINDLGAFSQSESNVLILLFDGFSGSHLKIILEQFPDFKEHLDGFTYYPNTISVDGHTTLTAHTILTGHNLSPYAQKEKSIHQYHQAVTNALKTSFLQFAQKGFEIQSYGMTYISSDDFNTPNIKIIKPNQDFLPYYQNLHNIQEQIQQLRMQNRPIGEMLSIGLFYFSPYVLRTRIYRDFEFGNYSWIFGAKEQIGSFINGISVASELPVIVRNLNTTAKHKTFKYIHTNHAHYPFALDSSTCTPRMRAPSQLPQEHIPFVANKNHYDNEICAIKETFILIDFLKKNKIYDNTMIVLVSDHSYNDIIEHKQFFKPSIGNNPNPLLMIKNFNSNAPLQVDSRLMSNADVYGILCDELNSCNEPNILKNYPESREIIHTLNIHWTQKAKDSPHLIFDKIWRVTDNVLDPNAFYEITKQSQ